MHPSVTSVTTAAAPALSVATHVHTDGPIPGPHSMLTLTSSAYRAGGVPIGGFTANLRELPGAAPHPSALAHWRGREEDWLWTRRATRPAARVASSFVAWLDSLDVPGERPVLVSAPEAPGLLFLFWYLQRFTGGWPFAAVVPPVSTQGWSPPPCPLSGCGTTAGAREVDDLLHGVPAA